MNVLIIDDQPDVVNGILAGVHWKQLYVDNIYYAYNINQAKDCFSNYKINIMLCDIEMPMGSGIDLLQWVRENYEDIKCIFLTCHAEFSYAQQAIKLECFDYILQPARYEDIEKIVQKAIEEINRENKINECYDIVLKLDSNDSNLLSGVMREYLVFQQDIEKVLYIASKFNIPLSLETYCNLILIQILDLNNERISKEELPLNEFKRILSDVSLSSFNNSIFIPMEGNYFLILNFKDPICEVNDLQEMFAKYIELCEKHIDEKVACYIADKIFIEQAPYQLKLLLKLSKDNVANRQKVFIGKGFHDDNISDYPDFKRWGNLINYGYSETVENEIKQYLQSQIDKDRLNIHILTKFHQDFLQLFFDFLKKYKLTAHEAFDGNYDYGLIIQACSSVDKMYNLVDYIFKYINVKQGNLENTELPIDKIINYIQHNLQNNITRQEISEAMHLNPQYLSRLFKKEKGINLSDFIIQEKMKIAESYVKNTNLTITIIASKVGYINFSYFTYNFKKIYGISPSDYRRQY